MALNLTISTHDDKIFPVQVDPNDPIENIKVICEAETGMPSQQLALLHNGRPLMGGTVTAAGIADGDLLMLMPLSLLQGAAGGGARPQQQQQQQQQSVFQQLPDGSFQNPLLLIQALKADPIQMSNIKASDPRLAAAIEAEDIETVQSTMRQRFSAKKSKDDELEDLYRKAEADPFDIEVQKKIEGIIQQKNVDEQYAHVMENNPEMMISVHMLYVEMEANGVHVKTFVDSGAQMTIMTQDFASKCHLMHLLDRRFHGVARGVGESKILGKIHAAKVKVGSQLMLTSITVLEQKSGPQFILGLDMLKRHRCCIDLEKSVLRIGSVGVELPFLPENQIPTDFGDMIEEGVSEADAAKRMEGMGEGTSGGASTPAPSQPPTAATVTPPAPNQASTPTPTAAPALVPVVAPQPTAAAGAAGAVTEEKIGVLVGLGMNRDMAISALQQTQGNVDMAASFMFMD